MDMICLYFIWIIYGSLECEVVVLKIFDALCVGIFINLTNNTVWYKKEDPMLCYANCFDTVLQ